MSEIKTGTAYPRAYGAIISLPDGSTIVARNGLNTRVHALAQVSAVKSGKRWVIIERGRGA